MSLDVPIFVSSVEDFNDLKKCQKIKFYCRSCGKLTERLFMRSRIAQCSTFCCGKCNAKAHFLEKYGVDNPAKSKEVIKKIQETNVKRYGNVCSLNGKEQIEKKKKTWQKHFGADNPYQNPKIKEKVKNNNVEKYGVEYPFALYKFKKKGFETRLKKYGSLKTCYLYKFDDIYFDSMWEIYFYIYCRDNGKTIKREPVALSYYIGNTKHLYYVDFKVDDKFYEIKSNYYLKQTCEEKINCMKENNVILISDEEIKKYQNYCKDKYPNLKELVIKSFKNETKY